LRALVERIERLHEQRQALADDLKVVYGEAKASGFDARALKHCVKLRQQDSAERREFETIVGLYLSALGMAPVMDDPARGEETRSSDREEIKGEEARSADREQINGTEIATRARAREDAAKSTQAPINSSSSAALSSSSSGLSRGSMAEPATAVMADGALDPRDKPEDDEKGPGGDGEWVAVDADGRGAEEDEGKDGDEEDDLAIPDFLKRPAPTKTMEIA
jgi:uncharacterized protein (UPF0335 family)